MANTDHVAKLKNSVISWNEWRQKNPTIIPDLEAADISNIDLKNANLSNINGIATDFSKADLNNVNLSHSNLECAKFKEANLVGANLEFANLWGTYLDRANLTGANLMGAQMIETSLNGATLSGCNVYGASVWGVDSTDSVQIDLNVIRDDFPSFTVDNLELAQFIHLIIRNKKIRDVIDTLSTKAVLILGRFTPERMIMLKTLREELRKHNYLPILFDFPKPTNRDLTETVSTLAHIVKFVVADITQARSIPQELSHIIPHLPSVPIIPLFQPSADETMEYGMFEHFKNYPWVLKVYQYRNSNELINCIEKAIIETAESKWFELKVKKKG